ncbi:hypothetical protein DVH24_019543 [Malus domestica]|uniref:Uncharacterized protein n=1 Tax=Malus domestica TaxID=3750 RepID=A0A498I3L5_MALDO|nr:hypothetical protein DVH24_019543 [Malus domestica]
MGNTDLKPDAFALSNVLPVFAEYVHVIKGKEIHGLESTGRKKATDHVPAVKKLRKSEMLGEGQVEATISH